MVAHHLVGLRVPPSPLSEVRTDVTQLGQHPADRVADARPTPAARSTTFLRSSLCRFSQSASAETSHAAMGTQRTGRTDLLCTAHRPTGMPWWWRQSRSAQSCGQITCTCGHVTSLADKASELEPVSGFEPLTCRLQGAIRPSWTVAGRRLISRLPAPIVAGRRPASVTPCLRWLPIWLPAVGAVPLMINRKRPGGCAVLRSQRTGDGDNPGLWLSRPGARCRIALGPFPRAARRTRRAVGLPAAGSPRFVPSGVVWHCPGAGDLAAAVEVPGDRHRCESEQLDSVRLRLEPPATGAGEPAADVFPRPTVQFHLPAGHPVPRNGRPFRSLSASRPGSPWSGRARCPPPTGAP